MRSSFRGSIRGAFLAGLACVVVLLVLGGTARGTELQVISSVSGTLSDPSISTDGVWRVVVEKNASSQMVAAWRSNNGTSWTRIALPATVTTGAVGINTSGNLLLSRRNASTLEFYKYTTSWSTVVSAGALASGDAKAVIASGTTNVIVATTGDVYSSVSSAAWVTSTATSVGTVQSVSTIGTTLQIVGSGGYQRWSVSTRAPIGTVNASLAGTQIFSAHGSTATLWAIVGGSGGLSVWGSTDSGATWVSNAAGIPVPYKPGVTFGAARFLSDGAIHLYGSAVVSTFVNVYEVVFNPTTAIWGTSTRVATTKTSGTLVIWPTQRSTGTQPATADRWLTVTSGATQAAILVTGGTANPWVTTSQTGTVSQPLSGVSGVLGSMYLAPSGTWRMVEERSGNTVVALWRSSDGLTWERVSLPTPLSTTAGWSAFGIGATGQLSVGYKVFVNWSIQYDEFIRFTGGEWYGPVALGGGVDSPQWLRSDGSTLAVGDLYGAVMYSTDNGNAWIAGGSVSAGTASQTSVVGSTVHVAGTTGVGRWSFTTKAPIGTVSGSLAGSEVFSTSGSTSSLWAVSGGTGGLSVWRSVDSGASWVSVVSGVLVPFRAGVSFGSARVLADGNVHLYGSAVVGGVVTVYEAVFDPVALTWAPVKKSVTSQTSGALAVWPTQRVSGVQPSSADRWVTVSSSTWTAWSVSAGVADPWSTTTQTGTSAQPMSGVSGSLGSMYLSPSGGWRMVEERAAGNQILALWRSADGLSWERVPMPAYMYATVTAAGIAPNGDLLVSSYVALNQNYVQFYRFTNGEWFGPATPGQPGTPKWLQSDGSTIVIGTSGDELLYSTNNGISWTSAGTGPTATSVQAIGNVLHLFGQGAYSRWSFATKSFLTFPPAIPGGTPPTVLYGYPTGGRVLAFPGSTTDLWMAWGGTALAMLHSTDGGSTWSSSYVVNESLPYGMTSTNFDVGQDGRVHFYATATCSAARLVYGASRPLSVAGSFSLPTPLSLDDALTATLLNPPIGGPSPTSEANDAWFATGSSPVDLNRVQSALTSPESVYGFDGYGLTANGVNLAIAGLVQSDADVSIAGVGPSLELARTYNSQDRRIGMFGRGWTSTFETRVYENCVTKDVTLLRGDGRREFYQWDGVSGYLTPAGYTTKLAKIGGGGWTLTETNGYVTTFRTDGRMTSVADADGQQLNLTWNGSNQLTTVTDAVTGRTLTFTYTGTLVSSVSTNSVTGPGYSGALTWNYVYSVNNLSKVCEPRNNNPVTGSCIVYTTTSGPITQITDRNGHVDRKVGYVGGKLAWTEDGLANRTNYSYPTSSKTIVTDPNGHATTSEFDNQYRLVKQTDAAGGVTTFVYDVAGFRYLTTDPLNHSTTRTFDANGNVLSETDALVHTKYSKYDSNNNLIESRDARSASSTDNTYVITTTWDGVAHNKLTESTPPTTQQPTGTTQSWTYTTGTESAVGGGLTPKGLLKTETDPRGAVATYGYDSAGNLRDTVDKSSLHTTYAYDTLGRRTSQTAYPTGYPSGVTTTFELDQLGNVVTQTDPAVTNAVTLEVHQHKTTSTYDGVSNLSQQTDSDIGASAHPDISRTTTYTFDADDRPTTLLDPEGGSSTKEYDAVGNITATIDQRGFRRETTYDNRNLPLTTVAKVAVTDEGAGSARDVTISSATYDAAGHQITATDGRGKTVTIAYDAAGQVTSKTLNGYHNIGGSTRDVVLEATAYDPVGHPTTVTTGGGLRTEQHTFDAAGRMVTSVLDPTGLNRTTTVVYDKNGNVVTQTMSDAARAEQTRAVYDAGNRVTSKTVENGVVDLVTTFTFDNRGAMLSMVEPRGNVSGATPADYRVDYQVDPLGRTIVATSPPVSVTENGVTTTGVRPAVTTGFDSYGQATQRRDERNNVATQVFDRLGRVTQIIHPAATISGGAVVSPTESFVFDTVGNLTSRTDRRGQTTTFTFDGLNRSTTQVDPIVGANPHGVITHFYDDTGNQTVTIDQRGARTEATFDDASRQRTSTSVVRNGTPTPDRFTTTYDYDDLGNRTFQQAPTGDVTRWEFSPASEQTKLIDPTLAQTITTHDVAGRVTSTTDPLGRSTTVDYDLAGRQTTQRSYSPTATLLTTATTAYDAAGNVLVSTSPRGVASGTPSQYATTYTYDAISRLTGVAQPTSGAHTITASYAYDAAGNQTAVTDGRGYTTSYTYNPWGLQATLIEPATSTFPAAADRTWTTEYDAAGLAVRTIEPGAVTVNRTFDELGRVTTETGSGTGVTTATRTFNYDAAGNRTLAGSPSGNIGFVYDDRGLLTQTTGPTQYQSSFNYDSVGRMLARTDAAGTTNFTWNTRNQLATIADPLTATSRVNTFDPAGQLTTVAYSGGGSRTLAYDDLGRLTSDQMKTAGAVVTAGYGYGYDPDGHITSRTVTLPGNPAAGASQYTYDNAGRLESWTKPDTTTAIYTYDDSGNLINNGGKSASYDARNQLQTSGTAIYTWTARGTLVSTFDTGVTTTSTFDGLNRNTATGATTYTYDSLDRVAVNGANVFAYAGTELDPGAIGTTRFSRSPAGLPIAAKDGANTATLFGRDRHGDIGYQHAADGTTSATRAYGPLGSIIGQTGTLTALGYQGDYTDPTSGDVWMGARWYRPGTGAFTNRDTVFGTLQTPVSLDRYTYAWADPLGMFDPDGREPASWCNTDSCTQIHERTRVMSHEALVSRLDEVRNMCEGGCGSGEVGSDLSDEMDVLEGRANDGRYGRNARGERAFAKFASSAIESATFPVQLAVRTGADLGNCAADHVFTDKHSDCFYTIKKTATGLVAVAKDPSLIVKGCVDDPVKCAGSIVGAVVAGGVAKELALPTRPATELGGEVGGTGSRIGYHATRPEYAESIRNEGFRLSEGGRLGGGGVYVSDSAETAVAEFGAHNPGMTPEILRVQYDPGFEHVLPAAPDAPYFKGVMPPEWADSVTAPSIQSPRGWNTIVRNGSQIVRS